MKYVIDINVLIHLLRNSSTWEFIDITYAPFAGDTQSFVSFTSVAEILSIAKQANWGKAKQNMLA